ncbi:MAG: HAMP domain-containing histidine kinase [Bacteroidetes bacterium]|jgi:signal transduction histidine kinase|nr:HAMP domain-containing histidine kinase [Bacteroidota bacterium]MBT6687017.1 HAMP domain-containing histidine kinase [Bacteroidota bacterium]MBT7144993.1 HAMP domain-containing histidine kinase [Bacteroidota bacterium]MBT7490105.1 HAMP domain-containing histidine kinase [Bacteroidota bacterium]
MKFVVKRTYLFSFIFIIGLISLQYYWVKNLIELREEKFRTELNDKLVKVFGEYEDSFYCIDLISENQISADDTLISIIKNADFSDTINYEIRFKYAPDYSSIMKSIPFPIGAKTRHLIHVEYKVPNEQADTISLITKSLKTKPDSLFDNYGFQQELIDSLVLSTGKSVNSYLDFCYEVRDSKNQDIILYENNCNKIYSPQKLEIKVFDGDYFFNGFSITLFYSGFYWDEFKNSFIMILSSSAIILLFMMLIFSLIRVSIRQKNLSEIKSDFIHNMAHEFKTPLSNINIAVDTISNKLKHKEKSIDKYKEIIHEELNHLNNIINKIMEVAVLEENKLQLNRTNVNIHELVSHLIEIQKLNYLPDTNFNTHFLAEKFHVKVDETYFINIFINLIDNAIKYSEGNKSISISTNNINNHLIIEFLDNGNGISKEHINHVFDKFFRVPSGKQHDIKGFGVGLYYVKQILLAHGASIDVTSTLGKGSNFKIKIPL